VALELPRPKVAAAYPPESAGNRTSDAPENFYFSWRCDQRAPNAGAANSDPCRGEDILSAKHLLNSLASRREAHGDRRREFFARVCYETRHFPADIADMLDGHSPKRRIHPQARPKRAQMARNLRFLAIGGRPNRIAANPVIAAGRPDEEHPIDTDDG
jgi:hypothetical protein